MLHVEFNDKAVASQLLPLLHGWNYTLRWELSPYTAPTG